jgi:O-methyltransferase
MKQTARRTAERAIGGLRRQRAERGLSPTAKQVRRERLTYLRPDRLLALERCADEINTRHVPGDLIECGVALGGSSVVLATRMGSGRHLHAYDVFGMIPPPTDEDPPQVHERYAAIKSGESAGIGGDLYYGYRDDLELHVARTLGRYGLSVGERVLLHKGLFEDTLHPSGLVALAHIDCDWHDPVDICLRRVGEHLSPGGFMVLDDYADYGGARSATDQFLIDFPGFGLIEFESNVAVVRR